jgi:hypothetical protein
LFVNILVVDTLDFNIYAVGRLRGRRGWMNKQKAPESVRTSGIALQRFWPLGSYNRQVEIWFHPLRT